MLFVIRDSFISSFPVWMTFISFSCLIALAAAAAAKSRQSCLTLCDPIDSSPPGFSIPGILQARTLEWVAISFSNAWKWKVKVKSLSCVRLLTAPWNARQEYWSGLPLPSPIALASTSDTVRCGSSKSRHHCFSSERGKHSVVHDLVWL